MDGVSGAAVAGVILVANVVAVVFTAWRLGGRCVGADAHPLDRILVTLVVGLTEICAILQLLGAVGLLSRLPVTAAHMLLAAAAARRVPPTSRYHGPARPTVTAVVAAAAAAAVACLALVTGLRGRSQQFETLHYHAANAGTWLRDHDLWGLPFSNDGLTTNVYPSNGELSAAWLMLPTGADQLAYGVNAVWLALAVIAVAALVRRLGGSAPRGALIALGLLVTPAVVWTQFASLLTDVAAAAGVAAAAALVLAARDDDQHRSALLVVAGAALGLGTGSKYTAFLPAAGVVALAVLVMPRARRVRAACVLVGGAVALTGFWLVRNAIETGNPVFPLAVGPLPGADSPLVELDESMFDHLLAGRAGPIRSWTDMALDLVGPALVVLPLSIVALFRRSPDRTPRLVAGLALACVAAYAATPFTGGGDRGLEFLIGSQLRYLFPGLLLSTAVAAATVPPLGAAALGTAMFCYAAVELRDTPGFRSDLAIGPGLVTTLVVAAAVTGALAASLDRWWPPVRARLAAPAVRVTGVSLLAVAASAGLHARGEPPPERSEQLLAALDADPRGPVLAVAVDDVRALMGARFDIRIVSPGDGGAAGERPILDPAALDRRIAALHPPLVAVGHGMTPIKPRGWSGPTGWIHVARDGATDFYAPFDVDRNESTRLRTSP